jgi:hypothetical protein
MHNDPELSFKFELSFEIPKFTYSPVSPVCSGYVAIIGKISHITNAKNIFYTSVKIVCCFGLVFFFFLSVVRTELRAQGHQAKVLPLESFPSLFFFCIIILEIGPPSFDGTGLGPQFFYLHLPSSSDCRSVVPCLSWIVL